MTDFSKMSDEELCVEVAKLLGWKCYYNSWEGVKFWAWVRPDSQRVVEKCLARTASSTNSRTWVEFQPQGKDEVDWTSLKAWSTSIADAWELVDVTKLQIKLHSLHHVGKPLWECILVPYYGTIDQFRILAPTAPRAICLAFLATRTK